MVKMILRKQVPRYRSQSSSLRLRERSNSGQVVKTYVSVLALALARFPGDTTWRLQSPISSPSAWHHDFRALCPNPCLHRSDSQTGPKATAEDLPLSESDKPRKVLTDTRAFAARASQTKASARDGLVHSNTPPTLRISNTSPTLRISNTPHDHGKDRRVSNRTCKNQQPT